MKINKIAGALAFLAATVLSSTASAASCHSSSPWVSGDTTYSCTVIESPLNITFFDKYITSTALGKFNDTYHFSISAPSDTAVSATNHYQSIRTSIVHDILNFNLSIFDSNGYQLDFTSSNFNAKIDLLTPTGDYRAVVSGSGYGTRSGSYTISLDAIAQPVPIPAAVWLLGSGLIGLVAVGRRKEV